MRSLAFINRSRVSALISRSGASKAEAAREEDTAAEAVTSKPAMEPDITSASKGSSSSASTGSLAYLGDFAILGFSSSSARKEPPRLKGRES